MSGLTKVALDDQNMVLFAQGKKGVKIPFACGGCAALAQRLESEGIPFYRNGKQV